MIDRRKAGLCAAWRRARMAALIMLFSLTCAGVACAAPTYSSDTDKASIEDMGGLLSLTEEMELLEKAEALAQETGMEFRIVTTDDADGRSTSEYAEDYFESLSESFEGGCYLLDMDNRMYYVATYGDLQYYLTDDRIDSMINHAGGFARGGDWEGTLASMLDDTSSYIRAGIQDHTVVYDEDTGTYTYYEPPKGITPLEGAMSGGVGLLGFLAVFFSTRRRYEMKVPEKNDYSAKDNVHLSLRANQDRLVDRHVRRRIIPRDNGGGHGGGGHGGGHVSTVHHTSGGHSAGGGGGHF